MVLLKLALWDVYMQTKNASRYSFQRSTIFLTLTSY